MGAATVTNGVTPANFRPTGETPAGNLARETVR